MFFGIFAVATLVFFITGLCLIYIEEKQNKKMDTLIEENNVERFFDNNSFLSNIKYQDSNLHNTIELCEVLEEARELDSKTSYSKMDDEII